MWISPRDYIIKRSIVKHPICHIEFQAISSRTVMVDGTERKAPASLINKEKKFTLWHHSYLVTKVCIQPFTTNCTHIETFYGIGDKTTLGKVIIFWWFKNKLTELYKDMGTKAKWKRKLKWEKGASLAQQKDFLPEVISVFRVSGFACIPATLMQ